MSCTSEPELLEVMPPHTELNAETPNAKVMSHRWSAAAGSDLEDPEIQVVRAFVQSARWDYDPPPRLRNYSIQFSRFFFPR